MIIRSKDKVQVIGKNKSVWVLDTNALTVTHNTVDTEPTVTAFRSEQIKYHLHYSAEYRKDRLRKLVNNGEILSYLTELDKAVENAMERQVEKWKADDKEYQQSLAVGDLCKAQGLENMFRLCARERACSFPAAAATARTASMPWHGISATVRRLPRKFAMKYWKVWPPVTSTGFRCWAASRLSRRTSGSCCPLLKM